MADRSIAAGSRDLARLRHRFQGQVLLPDEPGYHQARQVWNAMVDRRPAVIARCASPTDVAPRSASPVPRSWRSGCAAAATASWGSRSPRAG
jgi:hypothetical protein